jgi:RNA polymerase sigma factor (TIGR02999 family)
MESGAQNAVTRLLHEWRQGDKAALDSLMPMIEAELRRLAAGYMRKERAGHTLQPTALINEAWLRMAQQPQPAWEGRSHFIAIAAQYMRQILVDHARRKKAHKRGSGAAVVNLEDTDIFAPERSTDLVALNDGLTELARLDARQAQIVELYFFGGLTYEEIGAYLDVSSTKVMRDLRMAQAWLKRYVTA